MDTIAKGIMERTAQDVVGILIDVAILFVIPFVGLKIREFCKKKTDAIKDEQIRAAVDYAFKRLDETARTVTAEISQTLKNRNDKGKVIFPETLAQTAVQRIIGRIDKDARDTLEARYTPKRLEEIYRSKVETYAKAGDG